MNYESMSDHRINALVTSSVFGCEEWECNDAEFYHCGIDGSGYYSQPILDYCNNPADAWLVIIENEIGINKLKCEKFWIADKSGGYVRDENPLRAAMIVFLMMNKGE